MIKNIAEFIEALKEKEAESLTKVKIRHPGMIGDMFEGLTQELLKKSLPTNLDLNVRSGKIINSNGDESKQIDCMIVIGEGENIPYTKWYKYHIDNVIAVVEVKKNLHFSEMVDSYNNLQSVLNLSKENTRSYKESEIRLFRHSYKGISGRLLPNETDVKLEKDPSEYGLYYSLKTECSQPLRIVFGYWGYKSEKSLRDGFIKYLLKYQKRKNVSPLAFPNLVIVNNLSLIKCNGMPYYARNDMDDNWALLCSAHSNPINIMLELVFTRITYLFNTTKEIFGTDLILESFNRFVLAKCVLHKKKYGWIYYYSDLTEEALKTNTGSYRWEPIEVNDTVFTIFNILCKKDNISCNDSDFEHFLTENGYTITKMLQELIGTGLICINNNMIRLLTEECTCFISNGKNYVAENNNGRVFAWLNEKI